MPRLAAILCVAMFIAAPSSAGEKLGPAEYYWLMDRACFHGDSISVQMLLDAGADPSGPADYKAFLDKYNRAYEPSWHLCQAADGGHAAVMRLLLEAGANPNLAQGEGVTALTIAAEQGHFEVVQLLLAAGADIQYKTALGTAVELAERNGHSEIAAMIRSYRP